MKKVILVFFMITSIGFGQNLNHYQYALVPSKFSFLKEENMYNLNVLTKLLMQKYGFITYLSNETAPEDFINNNCNKVYVDVVANNSIFISRLKIVLKDCKGTTLFTSSEGTSNEKEYKVAYNLALRMAFENFEILKTHSYKPSDTSLAMIESPLQPKVNSQEKNEKIIEEKTVTEIKDVALSLYAQPILNGYQLIDTEPKVVYKIFKTSTKDFFIASKGAIQGVFFFRNNNWFFEFYQNDKLYSEKVNVKL